MYAFTMCACALIVAHLHLTSVPRSFLRSIPCSVLHSCVPAFTVALYGTSGTPQDNLANQETPSHKKVQKQQSTVVLRKRAQISTHPPLLLQFPAKI